jgi:hypothetical protein
VTKFSTGKIGKQIEKECSESQVSAGTNAVIGWRIGGENMVRIGEVETGTELVTRRSDEIERIRGSQSAADSILSKSLAGQSAGSAFGACQYVS